MLDSQNACDWEWILADRQNPEIRPYRRCCREVLRLPLSDVLLIRDLLELGDIFGDPALYAVLGCLKAAVNEGSLCIGIDRNSLIESLAVFSKAVNPEDLADAFLKNLDSGAYAALFADEAEAYKPLVAVTETGARRLYFHKYYVHETRLRRREAAFFTGEAPDPFSSDQIEAVIREITDPRRTLRQHRGGPPMELGEEQRQALSAGLKRGFLLITGGPGTGKTFLLVQLMRCMVRLGIPAGKIFPAAPTGKAGRRMTDVLRAGIASVSDPFDTDKELSAVEGKTLHRLLKYTPFDERFLYDEHRPLPAAAVIVDEASMVDAEMMDQLFSAIDPRNTRLILVGDRHQLPSVAAGAVFSSLIDKCAAEHPDRLVELKTGYRTGTRLSSLAAAAREGAFPEKPPVSLADAMKQPPDTWAHISDTSLRLLQTGLRDWATEMYLTPAPSNKDPYPVLIDRAARTDPEVLTTTPAGTDLLAAVFRAAERARVLTLVRRGPYGCIAANREIAAFLYNCAKRRIPPGNREDGPLFPGALVMITRNDYTHSLFNGDTGVLLISPGGRPAAVFRRAGGFVALPPALVSAWEMGFALTVHKSQGSEYDNVLVVFPDDADHRLLNRQIVYTGITRAKRRLILFGSRKVIQTALNRRIERLSGLI